MIAIDPREVQAKVAQLGVRICVAFPVVMFTLTLILKKALYSMEAALLPENSRELVGYIFIAVALADMFAALLLKRRLITASNLAARFSPDLKLFAKQFAAAYVPILAVCAAPALYGLIYFFVGGDVETYVLISIICPASYILTKPRWEEIESIARELFETDKDRDRKL
ncbi:MAG: hypothetical protein KAT58_01750 [candidate division Zixibacteria bacterium]|nr:hypothetical protein [candidate division Zixibacteria bacterium]